MNKNANKILLKIEKYLIKNPNMRFTQALFNLGINEFANKIAPKEKEYLLRDIYNDKDINVLKRIQKSMTE